MSLFPGLRAEVLVRGALAAGQRHAHWGPEMKKNRLAAESVLTRPISHRMFIPWRVAILRQQQWDRQISPAVTSIGHAGRLRVVSTLSEQFHSSFRSSELSQPI
jgi:hypothetical protein